VNIGSRGAPEGSKRATILELAFSGELWHWRGPAPFHFVTVPEDPSAAIHAISRTASYGWGVIPVRVLIGGSVWETSLFPKDGHYLLPIKDVVRNAERLAVGDTVTVSLAVRA
jgi:hypothetical protein